MKVFKMFPSFKLWSGYYLIVAKQLCLLLQCTLGQSHHLSGSTFVCPPVPCNQCIKNIEEDIKTRAQIHISIDP